VKDRHEFVRAHVTQFAAPISTKMEMSKLMHSKRPGHALRVIKKAWCCLSFSCVSLALASHKALQGQRSSTLACLIFLTFRKDAFHHVLLPRRLLFSTSMSRRHHDSNSRLNLSVRAYNLFSLISPDKRRIHGRANSEAPVSWFPAVHQSSRRNVN
jgi:hypothetical protein